MAAREAPENDIPPGLLPIRPADTGDIYDVYKLNCDAFVEAWSVMALGLWQERGDSLDVWYSEDGQLAAYYLGQDVLDEVHIMQIAVAPGYRRRGLARSLMRYEMAQKREAGMTQMLLEVRASNIAAQQLYASLGFVIVGRRIDYYAPVEGLPAEDALLMNIRL